jgi:hypothetical protein
MAFSHALKLPVRQTMKMEEAEVGPESSHWNPQKQPSVRRGFWVYVIAIWYTLTGLASLGNVAKTATPAPGSNGHLQMAMFELITAVLIAICLCVAGLSLFLLQRIALGAFCSVIVLNVLVGVRNLVVNGVWIARIYAIPYGIGMLGLLAASAYTYNLSRQRRLS